MTHFIDRSGRVYQPRKVSTLGSLKDILGGPLSEEIRARHRRTHKVAELLLRHLDLSQEEIETLLDQGLLTVESDEPPEG